MITVSTRYFTAEGTPGNLGGNGLHDRGDAYLANWTIWEVTSYDEGDDGVVTDVTKGDLFATGFIKCDGCSNWKFESDKCMFHACGKEGLVAIGDIMATCWSESEKLMPATWRS